MWVDGSFRASLRLRQDDGILLKNYARRNNWSICRAVAEAVRVATAVDATKADEQTAA